MGCPPEVVIGDNLTFGITTHDPDTAVVTDADSPPTYRLYEDETVTPILTGTMAKLDDGNTTGFYTELIAATASNGFEDGKTYTIYITAIVNSNEGGFTCAFKAVATLSGASGGATKSTTTTNWTRDPDGVGAGGDAGGVGSDTLTVNGTYFATDETGVDPYSVVEAIFTLDSTSETGRSLDVWGFYNGGGTHSMQAQAKDIASGFFEPLVGSIELSTVVTRYTFDLSPNHTDSSNGEVTIRFVHIGIGNPSHVFNVDKAQVNSSVAATGSGARIVAVTVDDGANPLENATVRFTDGASPLLPFLGVTDANGEISFSLDDATYTVAITKPAYSFTPTTLVVDANKTVTYSMTATVTAAPPNAATTTGVMTVYDEEGSVEEGVSITVQIIEGPGAAGIGYDSAEWAETSDVNGLVEFAGIILGARYKLWRGTTKANVETFTAPSIGTSFNLAEVIGRG